MRGVSKGTDELGIYFKGAQWWPEDLGLVDRGLGLLQTPPLLSLEFHEVGHSNSASSDALHHPFSATEASLLVLHCIRHPPPQKLLLTSFRVILKHFIHSNCSPFPPPFSSFILPFMACHIACTLSSPSLSYDHMLLPPECKLCEDARFCVAALVYLSSCSPGV